VTNPPRGAYRGERLGLPESGSGSLSTTGVRLAAFVVDAVASGLVAWLFVSALGGGNSTERHLPGSWSLLPLAIDYVVGMLVAGSTVGMYLFGLRIVRVDRPVAVNPGQAILRTVLLFLLVPAVIWDRDGRGLHDRASGTAVVRA
jgi:uncharacterized RDD family membrane protein YckC